MRDRPRLPVSCAVALGALLAGTIAAAAAEGPNGVILGYFPPFANQGGRDFQRNGVSIDDRGYETLPARGRGVALDPGARPGARW